MKRTHGFSGKIEAVVCYCEEERDLKPGARFGPVIRDIYIVECCTEGYGSVIINGTEFPVTPGSCYVLLPGDTVIHTADIQNPRKGIWCSLDGAAVGRYFAQAGISSENPFVPSHLFEKICSWIRNMIEVWTEDSAGAPLMLSSYAYGLLGTLLREKSRHLEGIGWIDRTVYLMESCYHDTCSIQWMADQIGLERSYFSTTFKKYVGIPPYRYLTGLRKACELLSSGVGVGEVALSVGMDPHNFARIFRKQTGKTPLQYQKEKLYPTAIHL